MATVQIKKLNERAKLPTTGSQYAAGYDLYACLDGDGVVTIPPHHTVRVGSGIAVALPEGTFGAVFARSGLASKEGLRPANCVGVVDCDYRGECMVAVHNDSDTDRTIHDGDRIAQMVLLPYLPMEFEEVGELPETARGAGGFGSTGK
ncbi:MAG: dUTP diphosphatase [Oscillospiraceae bacterium]|nr:dUTP diphosphatase [Oscillospiraceae bacterium]